MNSFFRVIGPHSNKHTGSNKHRYHKSVINSSTLIVGLRKQIKDTKDALEMDYDMVEGSEGTVDAGSTEAETPLDVRVKLGASAPAQRGRVKLGAGMTTRGLPLPVRHREMETP